MSIAATAVVFVGSFAHWRGGRLECFAGHVAVESGKITSVGTTKNVEEISQRLGLKEYIVTELETHAIAIPGFVDCHLHAPQFPNLGRGLDRPLLEWLAAYTFPLEKQYEDIAFATKVYDVVINRTLKNGTTTACYFGSLHLESSVVLAAAAEDGGQRALIGKVSMNRPNDADYFNDSKKEIEETENFIKLVQDMGNDLIEPVVTPRFAISCDEEVLKHLGNLAKEYKCRIQTHISENVQEVEVVKKMYPKQKSYAEVYDNANLLTDKCILAHAIYLEESEIDLLIQRGTSIAHCPASNTRLMSGLCPVRKYLDRGMKIGLGTDVSGGDSPSILDAMRRCMDVSSHKYMEDQEYASKYSPITWDESFYLATMGGAKALSLDHKIGNFEVGKEFDALIIDNFCKGSPIDNYTMLDEIPAFRTNSEQQRIKDLLQQFIYLGNEKNIFKVFVKGREIIF